MPNPKHAAPNKEGSSLSELVDEFVACQQKKPVKRPPTGAKRAPKYPEGSKEISAVWNAYNNITAKITTMVDKYDDNDISDTTRKNFKQLEAYHQDTLDTFRQSFGPYIIESKPKKKRAKKDVAVPSEAAAEHSE